MHILVILIIVGIVLYWLLLLLLDIIVMSLRSLPAWGVGVILIFLSQYFYRLRIGQLMSNETVASLMTVELDENNNKLNWTLEKSQVERYIKNNVKISIILSIAISLVSIIIILPMLYRYGFFNGLKFRDFEISPHEGLVWGYILSGLIILISLGIAKPKKHFEKSIKERASHLTREVNTQLERIDELCLLEKAIKSSASKLKISFPTNYQDEIERYIDSHKVALLLDTTELNKLIATNIKLASEDKSCLEKACSLFNKADAVYKAVSCNIIRTGTMPFVTVLEDIYARLNSDNLKSLLLDRKWKEYIDVVHGYIQVLKDLNKQSVQYKGEGREKDSATYTDETDKEKAYRILGIPSTATNERINQVWRATIAAWHPDGKVGKEKEEHEEKSKAINWAYTFLKMERNIT